MQLVATTVVNPAVPTPAAAPANTGGQLAYTGTATIGALPWALDSLGPDEVTLSCQVNT